MKDIGFVELHFHLLPGVDDGPPAMADSLSLASAAVADGTELVIATPHIRTGLVDEPLELPARVAELADTLRRERIPLRVQAGGELSHDMVFALSDAQLQVIAHGPPGARWVLLESPFVGRDETFTAAADELRARGFAVVVAHPERSAPGVVSDAALAHELAAGSALQINAWSIIGRYGEDVQERARGLLVRAPEAVIASDAHSSERAPSLSHGLGALRALGDPDPSARVDGNPKRLLGSGLRAAQHRRAA
jgi:protein-tyrosine phosphatase